jgi:hypothetical protein
MKRRGKESTGKAHEKGAVTRLNNSDCLTLWPPSLVLQHYYRRHRVHLAGYLPHVSVPHQVTPIANLRPMKSPAAM